MKEKLYFTVLSLLSVVGLWAIYTRLTEGIKVSALTSYTSWGLWIVFYIFFIGLSAGSFLLSTMVYVFNMKQFEKIGKLALFTALFSLMAGLLFVLMDLGHPERFWRTLVYRQPYSVLSWEIQFYLLYMVLVLAEIWFLMREELSLKAESCKGMLRTFYRIVSLGYKAPAEASALEKHRQQSHKWMKILGIAGIPTAIGVHGGTGSIFGVVMAKAYWNSGLTPIIFLVSALVSGAALMIFLYKLMGQTEKHHDPLAKNLSSLLLLFIGFDVLLMIAEFLIGLYNPAPEERMAFTKIVSGERWYVFWLGQVGLTVLLPITLIALSRGSTLLQGIAGLSVIFGIFAVRWTLVTPAYLVPHFEGLEKAYTDARLLYEYTPNGMEWLTSIGLISLVVLLFSISVKLIPVFEKKEGVNTHESTRFPHFQA